METDLPAEAITAAYAEFRNLYPQRMTPWDELARWEQERWQRIIAAAAPAIRAAERERIRALATERGATYTAPCITPPNMCAVPVYSTTHRCNLPFADLIGGE